MRGRATTRPALLALVVALVALGAGRAASEHRWTVEVLASESPALLEETARTLDGRIVRESSGYRLHVGRFATREAAEARARELRARFASAHARLEEPVEPDQPDRELRVRRRAMPGHVPEIEIHPGVDDWPPLRDPSPPPPFVPDERDAWAALHAGRPHAALDLLAAWALRAPDWEPSEALVAQAEDAAWRLDFERAAADEAWETLVALAEARPQAMGCGAPERSWVLARARVVRGEEDRAKELFALMIQRCDAEIGVATLQKTPELLGDDVLFALASRAGALEDDRRVRELVFGARAQRLVRAIDRGDDEAFLAEERELLPAILAREDARLAGLAGWQHLAEERPALARERFGSALAWSGDDENAYGLALALRASERHEEALAIAEARAGASSRFAELARAIVVRQAHASEVPEEKVSLLRRAESFGEASLDERRSLGWALFESGKHDEAAEVFAGVHEESPDAASAEGLAAALAASGQRDELRRRAREEGGAFDRNRRSLEALDEMYAGRAIRARELSPSVDAALEGVDALSLGGLVGLRSKKGREGLDRLELLKLPVLVAREVRRGAHRIEADLELVALDSGRPARDAWFGSAPAGGGSWSLEPIGELDTEIVGRVAWTREGRSAPDAALGVTPGGPAGRSLTLEAGWTFSRKDRGWRAGAHHVPQRESMLSFVGQVDPYSGRSWGGVMRSGVSLSGWRRLGERWGVAGNLAWESLGGKSVESNTRASLYASGSYDLRLPGFSYFSLGPFALYEGFDRNLSGFTLGHGGYFSPASLVDGGVALDVMTREARAFVVKGRASLGYDTHRVDEAPILPGQADERVYESSDSSGVAYAIELLGVWQPPGRHWQIGGGFSLRKTGGFEDGTFVVVLRRSGGARRAAFRMDLPASALTRLR